MRFLALLMAVSVLVACDRSPDYGYGEPQNPYENYKELRSQASVRCNELGLMTGSPEHRSCVGTQYTRLKSGQ